MSQLNKNGYAVFSSVVLLTLFSVMALVMLLTSLESRRLFATMEKREEFASDAFAAADFVMAAHFIKSDASSDKLSISDKVMINDNEYLVRIENDALLINLINLPHDDLEELIKNLSDGVYEEHFGSQVYKVQQFGRSRMFVADLMPNNLDQRAAWCLERVSSASNESLFADKDDRPTAVTNLVEKTHVNLPSSGGLMQQSSNRSQFYRASVTSQDLPFELIVRIRENLDGPPTFLWFSLKSRFLDCHD